MKTVFLFLFLIFLLPLTGCKVGPNYTPPAVVLPDALEEDRPGETFEIEDEELVSWWAIFNDPFLDELLGIAIAQNFDYKIALERVYETRSQYWVQFTQILPEFDATSVDTRYRASQSFASLANQTLPLSPVQNFFQLGLDAVWEVDVFGKFRRNAAAYYDLWQASEEDMRGIKIIMISEVINTYAIICALQKKRDIAEQTVVLDQELYSLSLSRFEAGLANLQEVESFLATWEADQAQLATTEAALKQAIYSLATLLGMLPEKIVYYFEVERPIPESSGKVPIAIPADLLRRRPDIRSAERQLAASTENIGVAVADLFPTLSLTGSSSSFAANPLQGANIGYSSDTFSKLFNRRSRIWGIGAFVTAPVFDFGKRSAAVDVQVAIRNQNYYAYQKTVISALEETEQALEQYFNDEKRERNLNLEVQSNWEILVLTQDLFQAGLANYTQVLEAKEIYLTSLNAFVDSQQALTTDLIAIYKALGGDW